MARERRYLYYDTPDGRFDLPESFPRGFVFLSGRFINIRQLAAATGLNYPYLYRIFHGERQPSLRYAERVATALEMSTPDFLRDLAVALTEKSQLLSENSLDEPPVEA